MGSVWSKNVSYSQRYGYSKIKALIVNEISIELKNGIMDGIILIFLDDIYGLYKTEKSDQFSKLCNILWHHLFKKSITSIPDHPDTARTRIIEQIQNSNFPKFYDYVEFFANLDDFKAISSLSEACENFIEWCNRVFEREHAPIRFVSNKLIELTDSQQIESIENAINIKNNAIAKHFELALIKLSDRQHPDYRNSVKESISAVEAAMKAMTGKRSDSFGDALKEIHREKLIDSCMKKGFEGFYGWTNGPSGIRHSLMDKDMVTESDARFMLVICSAFVHYLIANYGHNSIKDN
jgi:AbiJ N-terminal domain 4